MRTALGSELVDRALPASPPIEPDDAVIRRSNVGWMIAAAAFVGMLAGFTMHLMNLRMQNIGISGSLISLSVALQALAICVSAFAARWILPKIGLRATLATGGILCSSSLLAMFFSVDFHVISGLRIAFAVGLTPLVIASEYIVTAHNRHDAQGHVIAWYATALGFGTIAGPLLVSVININDASSFAGGAGMLLLGTAALRNFLSGDEGKSTRRTTTLGPLLFMPAAFYAAFVFGAADNGGLSMLPVYGSLNGYINSDAATLAVFAAIGATISPFPVSWIASRFDTTRTLVSLAIFAMVVTVALPSAIPSKPVAFGLAAALGAIIEGIYTVALIHLSRERRVTCLASLNACFVSMCSLGEVAGPMASSISMELLGPHGLVVTLAIVFALYASKLVNRSIGKSQVRFVSN